MSRALVTGALLLAAGRAAAAEPTAADPPRTEPSPVAVGVYVNDIQRVDLNAHNYEVNFYVWFRWRDRELRPPKTVEFINSAELWGHVVTPDVEEPVELPGGELYQVLRVQGLFSAKLPLYDYPFDEQVLTVVLEDSVAEASHLTYVPDTDGVVLNPGLELPGYQVGTPTLTAASFTYPTRMGDTRLDRPGQFSRVTLAVPISRPALACAVKLLMPILCVILAAALMFLLRPTRVDVLVGIGITALLTLVALQITTNEDLPDVGYLILMDKIYLGAYLYILFGLALVVRTAALVDGDALDRAIGLQRRGLWVCTGVFVAAVGLMVGSAALAG